MADAELQFLEADLAPGDTKGLELDREAFQVARVRSADDPLFGPAYERLWAEFGAQNEMEAREVIERRLAWQPARAVGDCWLRYDMIVVRRGGELAAVRDHTAIATAGSGSGRAVVHLSHVLVEPEWRRTGLAGWLRAWPIQTARECLKAAGFGADSPVTLVAEMEHADASVPARLIRLQAYEKAGFKKVYPGTVKYFQPDFRLPAVIDASGGPQPLPFGLVLRRVGREGEPTIRGGELQEIVHCLYTMYGEGFRRGDMEAVWATLRDYPAAETEVSLVPPTQ